MISKELLSLVLGEEIKDFILKDNYIRIEQYFHKQNALNDDLGLTGTSYGCEKSINMDTLGRLCKEWCLSQSTELNISLSDSVQIIEVISYIGDKTEDFREDTELEAIIKATEWVAKEKGLL